MFYYTKSYVSLDYKHVMRKYLSSDLDIIVYNNYLICCTLKIKCYLKILILIIFIYLYIFIQYRLNFLTKMCYLSTYLYFSINLNNISSLLGTYLYWIVPIGIIGDNHESNKIVFIGIWVC